jgi:hypothetical protein
MNFRRTSRVGAAFASGNTAFISPTRSVVRTSMDRSASSCVLVVFPAYRKTSNRWTIWMSTHHASVRRTRAHQARRESRPAPPGRTQRSSGPNTPRHGGTPGPSRRPPCPSSAGCSTHACSAARRPPPPRTRSSPRPRSARTPRCVCRGFVEWLRACMTE